MPKATWMLYVGVIFLAAACGSKSAPGGGEVSLDDVGEVSPDGRGGGGDVHIVPGDIKEREDAPWFDVPADELVVPSEMTTKEVAPDVWVPQECQSHEDCEAIGMCVEVSPGSGQMVCAPYCMEECPADWECKSIYVDGPDPVSLCVPPSEMICSVCSTDSQCLYAGSICIKGEGAVGFCGEFCHPEESPECPDGFECGLVKGKAGENLGYQCRPPAGQCCVAGKLKSCDDENPCTADLCDPSVGCQHKNIDGPCEGPEPCADYKCVNGACIGLPVTQDLILDGIDEDCDGLTDEDWLLAARIVAPVFSGTAHKVTGGGLTIRGVLSGPPSAGILEGGDLKVIPVTTKLKSE